MKRLMIAVLSVATMVVCASVAQAAIVIDFEAVAIRAANSDGTTYGTIVEYGNGNGVTAYTPLAGQKVYYGTDYFNGLSVGALESVSFKYKPGEGSAPYLNLVITDGLGSYGVIGQGTGTSADLGGGVSSMSYDFAAGGVSQTGYGFYESVGTLLTTTTWANVSGYTLLGVGNTRPLSTGEDTIPTARAPLTDGLAIIWGDSQANYLGMRDIFDIEVVTSGAGGGTFNAGVPEPATIIVWSLLGLTAAGFGLWRRKRAA